MIAVDASALVAILLGESEVDVFKRVILKARGGRISPIGYWEAATVLRARNGEEGVTALNSLIGQLSLEIAPASHATAHHAVEAERRFGKRTAARLNLGDCFAYALARELDAPLLFKGEDFTCTDVRSALPT